MRSCYPLHGLTKALAFSMHRTHVRFEDALHVSEKQRVDLSLLPYPISQGIALPGIRRNS